MEINQELRLQHVKALCGDDNAIRLYDRLCKVVEARPEGIDDASQHLVCQIAMLQVMKKAAWDHICKVGVREKFVNGRQSYNLENKSVGIMQRCVDNQRKLMSQLRITPASRRAESQGSFLVGDAFDTF